MGKRKSSPRLSATNIVATFIMDQLCEIIPPAKQ